jgi:hypothetical protein
MLSGGTDSAAALVKLLTESDEPVFAHHIINRDRESPTRFMAEQIASQRVAHYCRDHYRTFTYTQSVWDFQLPYFGWNLTLAAFVGARVLRSFPGAGIDKFALGVIDEPRTLGQWEARIREFTATFHAALITANIKAMPAIVYPVGHMTKKDILAFLHRDLLAMVAFCRDPVQVGKSEFVPCGTCIACNTRKEASGLPPSPPT